MGGIREFEGAAVAASEWIDALAERLGWRDKQKAYLALIATLHALRDFLEPDDAIYLAAQLPPLLRGFYYEGWHPRQRPFPTKDRGEFLARVHEGTHRDPAIDAEQVARAVLAELARRLPPGELEDAKAATPSALRALWPS